MDPYMKEVRRELKKQKEHFDLLEYVADAEYGIPTRCPCGGGIVDEVAAEEEDKRLPGKRYFTCKNYKPDGLHFRQPWIIGVEEEIRKLNSRGDEAEKLPWHVYKLLRADFRKMKEEVAKLQVEVVDVQRLKDEIAQLKMEVADLQRVL